jgi:hypothetical protein
MIRLLGNNEVEGMWNEMIMAKFETLPGICMKGPIKSLNPSSAYLVSRLRFEL